MYIKLSTMRNSSVGSHQWRHRVFQHKMERWRICTIALYSTLAVSFFGLTAYACYHQPLFPFQLDSLEWCRFWLGTTVADYYLVVASLSSIILATENWTLGILWVLGICLLGSPFACFYIVYRIVKGSTLKIVWSDSEHTTHTASSNHAIVKVKGDMLYATPLSLKYCEDKNHFYAKAEYHNVNASFFASHTHIIKENVVKFINSI